MSERFFVDEPITGASARLQGQEAHHLLNVLRAKIGDGLTLFDGSGYEFTASVSRCSRSEVELEIIERCHVERELTFELTLAVALPKGDRQRWLVEKLTELGVTRFVPLITARGVAQPTDQALERLRRFVIEASKQSGRNRLMTIAAPQPCDSFFATTLKSHVRVVAHPAASQSLQPEATDSNIAIAIGPEGGFSDEEFQEAIDQGWHCVTLGPRILRIETAAITAAAFFVQTKKS
jgi:16S rRNA (uracil1498-N3)-methyltransferase